MTETWRIIPAHDRYPGLTELKTQGRAFSCTGTGKDVKAALRKKVVDSGAPLD